ncbi:radical SAM protein [bacterium]|nr:radical SAM protein [bacterium]MBU1752420.1 radical SAM protein [bacterium]
MFVSWNMTKACNLRCKHCYRDAGERDANELNTIEGKHLLFELRESGCNRIIFSGGEALLRDDIYELIEYANSIGIRCVLGSNGMLIDLGIAKKLLDSGIGRVGISLDSSNPEHHDEFRQCPGAFEQTMSGINACLQAGLDFQIHTTVMDFNMDEIPRLSDMAQRLGAKAHHIFFLVHTGRAKELTSKISRKEYHALLNGIIEKQIKNPAFELKPTCAPQFMPLASKAGCMSPRFMRGCLAGIGYCCILPNGDISPCPYLPLIIGNIKETPFSVLWKESPILLQLRSSAYKGKCRGCEYREICGGCRARAYYYSKETDCMAADPWCVLGKA